LITQPSSAAVLGVVRKELSTLADGLTDPQVAASLAMINEVLRCIAVRCENEIAWMAAEISEIDELAARVIANGLDPNGALAGLLARVRQRDVDLRTSALSEAYSEAGQLLSCCIEQALPAGGAIWAAAEDVLQTRLSHEAEIRGAEFALVARG
jgi:hypothetical protein